MSVEADRYRAFFRFGTLNQAEDVADRLHNRRACSALQGIGGRATNKQSGKSKTFAQLANIVSNFHRKDFASQGRVVFASQISTLPLTSSPLLMCNLCLILFSNRTGPFDNRPSGYASLPGSFSFHRFTIRERWARCKTRQQKRRGTRDRIRLIWAEYKNQHHGQQCIP